MKQKNLITYILLGNNQSYTSQKNEIIKNFNNQFLKIYIGVRECTMYIKLKDNTTPLSYMSTNIYTATNFTFNYSSYLILK